MGKVTEMSLDRLDKMFRRSADAILSEVGPKVGAVDAFECKVRVPSKPINATVGTSNPKLQTKEKPE
jgi:hypothetical protein